MGDNSNKINSIEEKKTNEYVDLISIIVPVYNVERYLKQCIESLLQQFYSNIEIILIDDGSTDSSGAICDDYCELDPRIKVLHKKNGGLSESRNVALKIASGKFVGFVDSDDWVDKSMFLRLFEACKKYNAEIAVCGLRREYINTYEDFCPSANRTYNKNDAISELLKGDIFGDQACTKLVSIKLFEGIEYPVGKLYEDIYTTYKLFLRSNRIVTVDAPLYHYRQRKNSITGSNFNNKKLDIIYSIQSIEEDPNISSRKDWVNILRCREYEAKCWTLLEILLLDDPWNNKDLVDSLARDIYKNRKLIASSRYRSCRFISAFLPFGVKTLAFVLKNKHIKRIIEGNQIYYE